MAYENITLRKRNMTMVDGYYYMFDDNQDALVVKTDDGTQAYSYPLATAIDNQVVSLEFDGRNFWTLENPSGDSIYISRWNLENYVLQRRDNYTFNDFGGTYSWDSNAMTVEHYHLRLHEDTPNPPTPDTRIIVYMPKTKTVNFDLTTKLTSSMTVSLGPNENGQAEDISVSSVALAAEGGIYDTYYVDLNSPPVYEYSGPSPTASGGSSEFYSYRELYGDPVSFYTKIWIFNNNHNTDGSTGCLYSANAYDEMGGIAEYPGGEYQGVQACSFYDVPNYIFDREWQQTPYDPGPPETGHNSTNWPKFQSLMYVRTTNMIFLNVDNFSSSYGSMTMDNLDDDQATVLSVYDMSVEGANIYRLQLKATYYGQTYTFVGGFYNYQLATLEPFITSISLRANPAILPANGVNVSSVIAIVKDQFNIAIEGKQVYFTEDDPNGSITTPITQTDEHGEAKTGYKAGTTAREVKITATAQQTGAETPKD